MIISQIANVSSGVTLREGVNLDANGNACLIQMRDLQNDGTINRATVERIWHPAFKPSQLVARGDILFCARNNNKNTAALMEEASLPHIAALHLLVVRPQTEKVAPEYLLWCLNHPRSRAFFASRAKGTNLKIIGKKELSELPVPLPPLPQQKMIGACARLAWRRRTLAAQLNEKRFIHMQTSLWRLADGATKGRTPS